MKYLDQNLNEFIKIKNLSFKEILLNNNFSNKLGVAKRKSLEFLIEK